MIILWQVFDVADSLFEKKDLIFEMFKVKIKKLQVSMVVLDMFLTQLTVHSPINGHVYLNEKLSFFDFFKDPGHLT